MDWEFNKQLGSGKVSVVTLKGEGKWEIDTNDPLSQSSAQGKWLKRMGPVGAQSIVSSKPLTLKQVKKIVDRNYSYDDLKSLPVGSGAAALSLQYEQGPRKVTPLGDGGAVVLQFEAPELHARWQ